MTPRRLVAMAALLALATATSACGGLPLLQGGDDAEVVVVNDEGAAPGAGAADGAVGESAGDADGSGAGVTPGPVPGVELPVTFRYRGANWTVTELVQEVEDLSGFVNTWYRVELRVENPGANPIDVAGGSLRLRNADGIDVSGDGGTVSAGPNETVAASIEFPVPEGDPTGLAFAVVEPDLLPEVVSLAGGAADDSYPVTPGFAGTTGPVQDDYGSSFTTTALGATIDVNGDGIRAAEGTRLVTVQLRVDTSTDVKGAGLLWSEDHYRMLADGISIEPLVAPTYSGLLKANASVDREFVFQVPDDATTLELRVATLDGAVVETLPLDIGGGLPAYGER